jgi:hypothetical protein
VALIRTDVKKERIASTIMVERISELGYTVPNLLTLSSPMMEAIHSSEKTVITRVIWHHIPEDGILQL